MKFDKVRQGQPIEELKRKADKACRYKSKLWTEEEVDWAKAEGKKIYQELSWETK